ncbi:hypothetical protein TNCV_3071921 [Trichonephila clavipes]|nr:hypothetical protein TNCV_3071921 [Trichonephila clavipes]
MKKSLCRDDEEESNAEEYNMTKVAAVAEWYRYRTVACLVTGSSPVPLKTRRVGQRCTIIINRKKIKGYGGGGLRTREPPSLVCAIEPSGWSRTHDRRVTGSSPDVTVDGSDKREICGGSNVLPLV